MQLSSFCPLCLCGEFPDTAFWLITVGILANLICALPGCFLVLRRMSLLGDALSHGVLPGIALGFLFSGTLSGWGILIGAMVFGLLTAFLTQSLCNRAGVPEDASMGIVFTSLFALGVILISRTLAHVDLDLQCVFYGSLETVSLGLEPWLGLEVPRVLPAMLLCLVLVIGFLAAFWKELKIVSFDPALATAMGFRAEIVHYLLMALVAGVTVTSFSAVGSIMVVAMLIVPGACGHLLSDRLGGMLFWSALVAVLSAVTGYVLAPPHANLPGMMVVMAGLLFGLTALFAPRHGVLVRLIRNALLALRIVREDIVASLYRQEETFHGGLPLTVLGKNRLLGWLALRGLQRNGQVLSGPDGHLFLTEAGRRRARSLVRAHRLWEVFLEKNLHLPPDHLHDPATWMEHFIGPALQEELAADLHEPGTDPHGKSIPPGS